MRLSDCAGQLQAMQKLLLAEQYGGNYVSLNAPVLARSRRIEQLFDRRNRIFIPHPKLPLSNFKTRNVEFSGCNVLLNTIPANAERLGDLLGAYKMMLVGHSDSGAHVIFSPFMLSFGRTGYVLHRLGLFAEPI